MTFVSLHNLTGASVGHGPYVQIGGHISMTLDDGTQLHFDSLADLDKFIGALTARAVQARKEMR
jgi:hypothetical protein